MNVSTVVAEDLALNANVVKCRQDKWFPAYHKQELSTYVVMDRENLYSTNQAGIVLSAFFQGTISSRTYILSNEKDTTSTVPSRVTATRHQSDYK